MAFENALKKLVQNPRWFSVHVSFQLLIHFNGRIRADSAPRKHAASFFRTVFFFSMEKLQVLPSIEMNGRLLRGVFWHGQCLKTSAIKGWTGPKGACTSLALRVLLQCRFSCRKTSASYSTSIVFFSEVRTVVSRVPGWAPQDTAKSPMRKSTPTPSFVKAIFYLNVARSTTTNAGNRQWIYIHPARWLRPLCCTVRCPPMDARGKCGNLPTGRHN